MVKIEERLLNAPHGHLVGLVKGQQDCCKERPVHLRIDTKASIVAIKYMVPGINYIVAITGKTAGNPNSTFES